MFIFVTVSDRRGRQTPNPEKKVCEPHQQQLSTCWSSRAGCLRGLQLIEHRSRASPPLIDEWSQQIDVLLGPQTALVPAKHSQCCCPLSCQGTFSDPRDAIATKWFAVITLGAPAATYSVISRRLPKVGYQGRRNQCPPSAENSELLQLNGTSAKEASRTAPCR